MQQTVSSCAQAMISAGKLWQDRRLGERRGWSCLEFLEKLPPPDMFWCDPTILHMLGVYECPAIQVVIHKSIHLTALDCSRRILESNGLANLAVWYAVNTLCLLSEMVPI